MKSHYSVAIIAAVMSVLFMGMAAAAVNPNELPQAFYGYVTVNGAPSPDGVLISAKFNGKDVEAGLTSGGMYGYPIGKFVVALDQQYVGQTIDFYVQNVKAGQFVFNDGAVTRVDLSATIAAPPAGGGGGTSGTSGGGGGSVGGSSGGGFCQESWICTDWLDCSNSVQKRVCADVNRCGTNTTKPVENQSCVVPVICQAGEKVCAGNDLTVCSALGTTWIKEKTCEKGCSNGACNEDLAAAGPAGQAAAAPLIGMAFFDSSSWPYWIIIIVIVIAILAWFFLFRKKGKKQN